MEGLIPLNPDNEPPEMPDVCRDEAPVAGIINITPLTDDDQSNHISVILKMEEEDDCKPDENTFELKDEMDTKLSEEHGSDSEDHLFDSYDQTVIVKTEDMDPDTKMTYELTGDNEESGTSAVIGPEPGVSTWGGGYGADFITVIKKEDYLEAEDVKDDQDREEPPELPKGQSLGGSIARHNKAHNWQEEAQELMRQLDKHKYLCDICGASYFEKLHLESHINEHHTDQKHTGEKLFGCDKSLTWSGSVEKHNSIPSGHAGWKPYNSDLSKATFTGGTHQTCTGDTHQTHAGDTHRHENRRRRRDNRTSGKMLYHCDICSFCGKMFSPPWVLKKHVKEVHIGHVVEKKPVGMFICDKCEASFTHVSNLALHMKSHYHYPTVKETESCDICSFCGKTFSPPWVLKEHIQEIHIGHVGAKYIHVKEEPVSRFSCDKCVATYTTESYMKQHIRSNHTTLVKNHSQ